MNIKINIYKYLFIYSLFFSFMDIKANAQSNVNIVKGANLPLTSLVIVSSMEWNKDKLLSYPKTLNMDNNKAEKRKYDIHFTDTFKPASVAPVLSPNLLNFSFTVSNKSAILQWKASNLPNAREFVIEQSRDGQSYQEVSSIMMDVGEKVNGVIIPQGNGLSYYRLKVLDKDGSAAYTESLACNVETKANEAVSVYPNIISDEWLTALNIVTDYRGRIKVVITDDHGHQLIEFHREIIMEKSKIPIGVATIPKGAYYIFVSMKDGSHIGPTLELIKS